MENEKALNVNLYSLASFLVEIFYNDRLLSTGTCFFSKRNDNTYMITNWHVVSGRNADTKQCLDSMGSLPNKLRIFVPEDAGNETIQYHENSYRDVQLYDENDNRLWYEMEVEGRVVDVAVIPLDSIDFPLVTIEDAEEPFNTKVLFEITSEIFIIGFPFAKKTGFVPIWKKATVASEPEIDIEGLPYFYADTATKDGMSGSPVVLFKVRPVTMFSVKQQKMSRHWTKFIGVYSGRIGVSPDTRNDAQLCRIWKAEVIDKIITKHESP